MTNDKHNTEEYCPYCQRDYTNKYFAKRVLELVNWLINHTQGLYKECISTKSGQKHIDYIFTEFNRRWKKLCIANRLSSNDPPKEVTHD